MEQWGEKVDFLLAPLLQCALAGVAVLAAYQLGVGADYLHPIISVRHGTARLANNLSEAYVSSWIFNLLVIVLPALGRRRRIRRWLRSRYLLMKDNLVRVYLSVIEEDDEQELIYDLRSPQRFLKYFTTRHTADQIRWDAVHNGLYERGIPEIRAYCQSFVSDCDLAIGMVGELNEEAAAVVDQVRFVLLRLNLSQPEYDDIKLMLNILFPMHCPWKALDGGAANDALLKKVGRI